jgi:hypothetical protein
VLREFFVTLTRKVKMGLSNEQAGGYLDGLSSGLIVTPDYPPIPRAIPLCSVHSLSLWDALASSLG